MSAECEVAGRWAAYALAGVETALAEGAGARALAAMRQAEAAITARVLYWDDDHAPEEDAGATEHGLREALVALRAVIGGGTA